MTAHELSRLTVINSFFNDLISCKMSNYLLVNFFSEGMLVKVCKE